MSITKHFLPTNQENNKQKPKLNPEKAVFFYLHYCYLHTKSPSTHHSTRHCLFPVDTSCELCIQRKCSDAVTMEPATPTHHLKQLNFHACSAYRLPVKSISAGV